MRMFTENIYSGRLRAVAEAGRAEITGRGDVRGGSGATREQSGSLCRRSRRRRFRLPRCSRPIGMPPRH